MSRDKNEAIVRRFVDMWDTQKWRWNHKDDWSEFDEILSSDFVEHYGSEDVVGVQGFKEEYKPVFTAFPDFRGRIEVLIGEGDKIGASFVWEGTHRDDFQGIAATGKQVAVSGTGIYRIQNGKIAEIWAIDDGLGLVQQLQA